MRKKHSIEARSSILTSDHSNRWSSSHLQKFVSDDVFVLPELDALLVVEDVQLGLVEVALGDVFIRVLLPDSDRSKGH